MKKYIAQLINGKLDYFHAKSDSDAVVIAKKQNAGSLVRVKNFDKPGVMDVILPWNEKGH